MQNFERKRRIIFVENKEQKRFRLLAYANFQFLCLHNELLKKPKLNDLFTKLLDYFTKLDQYERGTDAPDNEFVISLAKELSTYRFETIVPPQSESDVLSFAGRFDENRHLLIFYKTFY